MAKIRVTKRFHFEMAHALHEYDGLCSNIHGHSYNLEITIAGEVFPQPNHPKDGMVMDFHVLKTLVKSNIVDKFDHSLMVSSLILPSHAELLEQVTSRVYVVDFQPTTENLVAYIAQIIAPLLPAEIELVGVRLYETSTSYAEWFASDNL